MKIFVMLCIAVIHLVIFYDIIRLAMFKSPLISISLGTHAICSGILLGLLLIITNIKKD